MKTETRYINGVSMSEVQTAIGNINISTSKSASVIDRVTPGLAIKYVSSGKEMYQLKNKCISISKGKFFLLRDNTYFKAANTNKHKITTGCCINLNLDSSLIPDTILNNDLLFETPFSAVITSELGFNLHSFASRKEFDSTYLASKIPNLPNLVQSLSQDVYLINTKLSNVSKKKKTKQAILEALFLSKEYIHQYYKEKIILDDLAKLSGLSKYHLLRLFSRCYGISPIQLQLDLRMEEAIRQLQSQSLNITDIAISLGYTDLASFSNHFKRKFGVTPSKYTNSL